jgi:hypothetical protein
MHMSTKVMKCGNTFDSYDGVANDVWPQRTEEDRRLSLLSLLHFVAEWPRE